MALKRYTSPGLEFLPFLGPLALLAAPVFLFGWVGPNVASRISGSKNAPVKMHTVAGRVIHQSLKTSPQCVGKVKLEYPLSIKVSETINVRAWLQPDATCLSSFAGKLESGDFKITATNSSDAASPEFKYEWDWLLSPDKPGNKALYFWVDPSTQLTLDDAANSVTLAPSRNKAFLPIVVTNDLGLTTTQDAWAKAIGAFLGLVGTVAGYSFLKRYLEKKKGSED